MCRKLIRRSSVLEFTGMSDGTLRRLVMAEQFPKPIQLTIGGSVAWYEDEVEAWIESLQIVTPETHRQVAPGSLKRGRPSLKTNQCERRSK
ncbi:MAG: AlpA family phage regulatory protein [Candidatus Cloacimonetes bacterium]|nr:AlpA family phage regulatory protein [Candidatus Cloacimonadota bacterium]